MHESGVSLRHGAYSPSAIDPSTACSGIMCISDLMGLAPLFGEWSLPGCKAHGSMCKHVQACQQINKQNRFPCDSAQGRWRHSHRYPDTVA